MSLLAAGIFSWKCSTLRRTSLKRSRQRSRSQAQPSQDGGQPPQPRPASLVPCREQPARPGPRCGSYPQTRLFSRTGRGCREKRKPFCCGRNRYIPKFCRDRFQPCLLCERQGPRGRGKSSPAALPLTLIRTFGHRLDSLQETQ
jgi:hypothetical protein